MKSECHFGATSVRSEEPEVQSYGQDHETATATAIDGGDLFESPTDTKIWDGYHPNAEDGKTMQIPGLVRARACRLELSGYMPPDSLSPVNLKLNVRGKENFARRNASGEGPSNMLANLERSPSRPLGFRLIRTRNPRGNRISPNKGAKRNKGQDAGKREKEEEARTEEMKRGREKVRMGSSSFRVRRRMGKGEVGGEKRGMTSRSRDDDSRTVDRPAVGGTRMQPSHPVQPAISREKLERRISQTPLFRRKR